jgi:hypothetical protein
VHTTSLGRGWCTSGPGLEHLAEPVLLVPDVRGSQRRRVTVPTDWWGVNLALVLLPAPDSSAGLAKVPAPSPIDNRFGGWAGALRQVRGDAVRTRWYVRLPLRSKR